MIAEPLLSIYERCYCAGSDADGPPGAFYPFFYLKNDKFWTLHSKPGREEALDRRRRVDSEDDVAEDVSHVTLDPALHTLMLDPAARGRLRTALIDHWFADRNEEVDRAVHDAARRPLRWDDLPPAAVVEPYAVRDAPFRRNVLEAYDYRCAATGWRVIFPGAVSPAVAAPLVDAARLVPRVRAGGDAARFGIALTPTYHRALDACLIAPGPDMRWRVSRLFRPRALQWRIDQLRTE